MAPDAQGSGVEIVRATGERWDDVATVFGTRGDPSWCWCQFPLTTGSTYEDSVEHNRAALREELSAPAPGRAVGLLAYVGGEPVGWAQLGPRARFPRVTASAAQSALLRRVGAADDAWRVTCFVVRVGHRRAGVATALLDGAIAHAREAGARSLEGNPVDVAARSARSSGASLFPGALSTFLAAGFREVGRTGPTRPLVVLDL
ncbi:N-acetyltransferase family protein [Actinotalea sp.]|uniref:GNAT family N-acetyltransferase n=1 Tax=Actinotalea sp. TaxID=1872145 RepID=UPI00356387B0